MYGRNIPVEIAGMIARVYPVFDREAFTAACLDGFDELELTPRARHIARALKVFLPVDPAQAMEVLVASLGPPIGESDLSGMGPFIYLPHVFFVAEHGLEHFEDAMHAQYELTQRFTAEFSIRAYLDRYPDRTLAQLRRWAGDSSVHVRRLVSEGTRPRLPWAPRLERFRHDPGPVIDLLELLKDDPEEYVRRSVANNLNDISKDHPELVVAIARRWWSDSDHNRRRLVRHALRTVVKQGDAGALAVLGFGSDSPIAVVGVRITPEVVHIGDRVRIEVEVHNPDATPHGALVDLVVHFVKASGSTGRKVFKGAEHTLGAGEGATIRKTISLAQHTTRTHHPGRHRVDIQVNGAVAGRGEFRIDS
jgi:3-methyladenine DNA glycosylase AlkC